MILAVLRANQLEFVEDDQKYTLPCPVHGSDNHDSCNIYKNTGVWKCRTNHCEKNYGTNFMGFIRGIYQTNYYGACRELEKITHSKLTTKPKLNPNLFLTDENFESHEDYTEIWETLTIPPEYYPDSYKTETFEHFRVASHKHKIIEMNQRIIVPCIFGDKIVGCLGRTVFDQCNLCDNYHSKFFGCPTEKKFLSPKWKNSPGFRTEKYLYNYNGLRDNDTAILVEGQGDVWRIWEAGFPNAVGMFGDDLSRFQRHLLTQAGITHVIIFTDNDEAGLNARNRISDFISRYFNVTHIETPNKDPGNTPIEILQELLT